MHREGSGLGIAASLTTRGCLFLHLYFAAWFWFRAWRQGEETPFAIDSDVSCFFFGVGKHMRGSSCTVHIWGRDRRRVEDNGIHFPDSNHTEGQAHVIPAEPQCRAADQPSAPGVGIRRTSYGFCHSEVRRRRSPSQRGWEKRMRLTAIDEEWTRRSRSRGHFPCGVVTKLGPRRAPICRSPKPPASRNAASPWGRCGTFPDRPW